MLGKVSTGRSEPGNDCLVKGMLQDKFCCNIESTSSFNKVNSTIGHKIFGTKNSISILQEFFARGDN